MSPDIITATGDLFPTVTGVASNRGVAMNAPPASIFADVSKLVHDTMMQMPDGERLEIVTIATHNEASGETNVNLALAWRAGKHVEVVHWIGKSWGTPVAAGVIGTAIRVHI